MGRHAVGIFLFQQYLIDLAVLILFAEVILNAIEAFLFFSQLLLLLHNHVGDLEVYRAVEMAQHHLPIDQVDLHPHPVSRIELVDIFEHMFDGVFGVGVPHGCLKHFDEFVVGELATDPLAVFVVGVQKEACSIEEVILKLSDVEIPILEVPLAIIFEPVFMEQSTLIAFQLQILLKLVESALIDPNLDSHPV